jgi:hypothetical protein
VIWVGTIAKLAGCLVVGPEMTFVPKVIIRKHYWLNQRLNTAIADINASKAVVFSTVSDARVSLSCHVPG